MSVAIADVLHGKRRPQALAPRDADAGTARLILLLLLLAARDHGAD